MYYYQFIHYYYYYYYYYFCWRVQVVNVLKGEGMKEDNMFEDLSKKDEHGIDIIRQKEKWDKLTNLLAFNCSSLNGLPIAIVSIVFCIFVTSAIYIFCVCTAV